MKAVSAVASQDPDAQAWSAELRMLREQRPLWHLSERDSRSDCLGWDQVVAFVYKALQLVPIDKSPDILTGVAEWYTNDCFDLATRLFAVDRDRLSCSVSYRDVGWWCLYANKCLLHRLS